MNASTFHHLRSFAIVIAALLLVFGFRPAPVDAQDKNEKAVDSAVAKALEFLHRHKLNSGGGQFQFGSNSTAIKALQVMAFLSAGHLPGEGPYGKTITDGIRYILKRQRPNDGLIASGGGVEMYHHGIATMMLAEVVGMVEGDLGKEVRAALPKAVKLILAAQRKQASAATGGWRYSVNGYTSDLSVTGWQLLALKAAHNVGCDVPIARIDAALKFIHRCWSPRVRGFAYLPSGQVTVPCTGTGILCVELCGTERHTERVLRAASYLLRQPTNATQSHYYYGMYYASQAMFQLGGNYWIVFRGRMHKELLRQQQPNGSWNNNEGLGPHYSTAMAVLALTVEYRLLPLYQRGSDTPAKE